MWLAMATGLAKAGASEEEIWSITGKGSTAKETWKRSAAGIAMRDASEAEKEADTGDEEKPLSGAPAAALT
jgi:hypothetical protein